MLTLLCRPACEVEEKMECVENTVSQCSFETRVGSTGEEEQVEVGWKKKKEKSFFTVSQQPSFLKGVQRHPN